ncbi:MAG: hypothetical protein ACYTGW_11030 [Planctomycetota bacterium]|jgi:hypothetical protein
MKTLITTAVLASAAAIGCQAPTARQPKAPALENTRWHVTATTVVANKQESERDAELVDALLFGTGTMASAVQQRKGFAASAYTITRRDGKWQLAVQQANGMGSEVTWNCEITDNKISGTMKCKHKGGTIESFKLTGVRAPALETTCWRIKVTDASDDQPKPVEDTMLFAEHKMTSKAAGAKGFMMCAYSLVPEEAGIWVLEAAQRNRKDKTRLVWSGEVKGNTIKGTLTVLDPDSEIRSESTFEGSKTNKRVRVKKRSSKRKKGNKKR